ncbi:AI-2E family transporter [Halomicronema hongdechloris C2206]|uniref:AI-2E family transporter n=1 Tax=Halomicronema hongdechloris C2206 TaxID=1641165 RepID=A0A1Z3HT35_9CYAN|nr:AI-2E family transporter [Halomicronema hongdechloris]ASC73469.1 AI-2E family transporter [Halomicronema hongdechloris C2206]
MANRESGEQRLTLSVSSLLVVLLAVPLLLLVWQLRSLILLLLISVVLASSIAPVVDLAERYRVPRWLGVVLVYLTMLFLAVGAILLIGPTIFEQIQRLLRQIPVSLKNVYDGAEAWVLSFNENRPELASDLLNQFLDIQGLTRWVIRSSQQLLLRSYGLTTGILGGVLSLILALFLSGYMLADSRTLIRNFLRLLPQPWDERLAAQVTPVSNRIGSYIRGRLLVSAILAVVITIVLSFIGLSEFALGLGAIAGVTNLIPFLGPILGAIPALAVAVSQGGWTVLWVLVLYVIIQNLETYVLDPLLVGSSVGVHPLYQLLAVIGGTQVLGIIGALIVPPWIAGGAVLLENLYLRPKLMAERRRGKQLRSASSTNESPLEPDTPIKSVVGGT